MINIKDKGVSGVYQIKSLRNNEVYIGSSKCVYSRMLHHACHLYNGNHRNKRLQKIYNEDGLEGINFEILELSKLEELRKKEQHYINIINPSINIVKNCGSEKPYKKKKGKKHTVATKKLLSDKAKERGLHPNFKAGSIKANTGKEHSQQRIEERVVKQLKLCKEQVLEIRKLLKQGIYQKDIAKQYNVSQRNICRINLGIGYYSNF